MPTGSLEDFGSVSVQQSKPPLVVPASYTGEPVQVLVFHFHRVFCSSSNEDGPRAQVSALHIGDFCGGPASQLQPGPALPVTATWGVN